MVYSVISLNGIITWFTHLYYAIGCIYDAALVRMYIFIICCDTDGNRPILNEGLELGNK